MSSAAPYRVLVMLSGNGATFEAIHRYAEHHSAYKVVAVISSACNAYGLSRASRLAVPAYALECRPAESRLNYNRGLLELMQRLSFDLVVLAGFMPILTQELLEGVHCPILNIHPSLLPRYRGLNTHQRVLVGGEREHGATVHGVTNCLDQGPILAQARFPILPQHSARCLEALTKRVEQQLYPMVIEWVASGRLVYHREKWYKDQHPLGENGVLLQRLTHDNEKLIGI